MLLQALVNTSAQPLLPESLPSDCFKSSSIISYVPNPKPEEERTSDSKSLSMVVAPTVKIQGATLTTVLAFGPLFPAEQTTVILFSTAWNAPMATGSTEKSGSNIDEEPSESDSASTPSAIASSNAARMADPRQP